MNKNDAIVVLYHIFYEDSHDLVCRELNPLLEYRPVFLFNICCETPGKKEMSRYLKNAFPGCFIIFSSNKGKDIGGKLALLQLIMQLNLQCDYILFLHDKKSLQALKSATWKNDLLKIILPANLEIILQYFRDNILCGIIATKEYIITEPAEKNKLPGINGPILQVLQERYQLYPSSFEFVGGTMFWVRTAPIIRFFEQYNPLDIRKQLEYGNVIDNFSGTVTHSWERLLNWIMTTKKFYIHGI